MLITQPDTSHVAFLGHSYISSDLESQWFFILLLHCSLGSPSHTLSDSLLQGDWRAKEICQALQDVLRARSESNIILSPKFSWRGVSHRGQIFQENLINEKQYIFWYSHNLCQFGQVRKQQKCVMEIEVKKINSKY